MEVSGARWEALLFAHPQLRGGSRLCWGSPLQLGSAPWARELPSQAASISAGEPGLFVCAQTRASAWSPDGALISFSPFAL